MADIIDREGTENECKHLYKKKRRQRSHEYCLKALIDNAKQIEYDTRYDVIP